MSQLDGPLIAECSTWLSIVSKQFNTRMGVLLAPHGLTPAQFSILHHVVRPRLEGDHSVSSIAAAVEVEQPAVTKTIAKFQNLGLVAIEPHPKDKRAKVVRATPQAGTLLGKIYADIGPDLGAVFGSLGGSDIAEFARQLKVLGSWLDKNRL
ncbi:MarR family winged helix-turn-helix transcriptional regulator [Octadecabacter sp.]|nr:MarR family winged helix-turn-helix transcriptional regulator [Octadecabacter sp.]